MKKINKTNPANIKLNDIMAVIHYVKITSVNPGKFECYADDLDLTNRMSIQGKEILEAAFSADQFSEELKVPKTKVAEILVNSPNRPFTVNFNKTDGSERTLRGRLVCPEPLLGRSMVEDLDDTSGHNLRQVDHRTINWLIVEGTKYIVK
jgi:hypothetical protein